MDEILARDLANVYAAYADRLSVIRVLAGADAEDEEKLPFPTDGSKLNSEQWRARRLHMLRYVEHYGGTIEKALFVAEAKRIGYHPSGIASYWNKPEDKRLLHERMIDGKEHLSTSLKATDIVVAADEAA